MQAIVVKTGSHTQVGQIQTAVANVEVEKTPLNQQLDEFGNNLALIIAGICVAVWTISIPRFDDPSFRTTFDGGLYYAKVGVALGVAAIPEGNFSYFMCFLYMQYFSANSEFAQRAARYVYGPLFLSMHRILLLMTTVYSALKSIAVITLVLALGVRRLAEQNVIGT